MLCQKLLVYLVPVYQKIDPVALVKMAEARRANEASYEKQNRQLMCDVFELADVNKDGLLNAEEFADHSKKLAAVAAEVYGDSASLSDAEIKLQYDEIYNQFTLGVEGVSEKDLCGILDVFKEIEEGVKL